MCVCGFDVKENGPRHIRKSTTAAVVATTTGGATDDDIFGTGLKSVLFFSLDIQ